VLEEGRKESGEMEGSLIQSCESEREREREEEMEVSERRGEDATTSAEERKEKKRNTTNLCVHEPSPTVASSFTIPRTLVVTVVPIHVRIQSSSTFRRRWSSNAALAALRREEGGDDG